MFEVNDLESKLPNVETMVDGSAAQSKPIAQCDVALTPIKSVDALAVFKVAVEWRTLIIRGWDQKNPTPIFTPSYQQKHPDWKPSDWSRSQAVFALIGYLCGKGVPDGIILHVITCPDFQISAHCIDNGGEVYARKQIKNWREKNPQGEGRKIEQPADGVILYGGGRLLQNLECAESALMTHSTDLYQQSTRLLHPVVVDVQYGTPSFIGDVQTVIDIYGVERQLGSLILLEADCLWVVRELARVGSWQRRDSKGLLVDINPPPDIAAHIVSKIGEWRYRVLKAVTGTPILRPDGNIVQTPGYDAVTELLYNPHGAVFPDIPLNPTKDDAANAMAILKKPFEEYLFADNHKSVALAMMMTAVVRATLRSAPMFAVTAGIRGSGKSKLTTCAGILASGRHPSHLNFQNIEELVKQLTGSLLASDSAIWIDNISRPLGGIDILDSMLTEQTARVRPLGGSKMVDCPCTALVMATGNNLVLTGDIVRRSLPCRIETDNEKPEEKTFSFDPVELVKAHRSKMVSAVLTILRAYIVAGKPSKLTTWGSFESFNLVRGVFPWLDMNDPHDACTEIDTEDESRPHFDAVITEWYRMFGGEAKTCAELVEAWKSKPEPFRQLKEALIRLSGTTGFFAEPNAVSIGKTLRTRNGQFSNGLKLTKIPDKHSKITRWRVKNVNPSENVGSDGQLTFTACR
jgi:hypothetical protein